MALSAKFEADFSTFTAAVENAQISLRGFEASTNKVEGSLTKMVDSFSGRKIITEATLLAEVFGRVGGTAQLTTAELARVAATAQEARAKFLALGQDVPPRIQALAESVRNVGTAAKSTAPSVNTLQGALNQFDGVLGALGVHMGPEIRGLGELGQASGKSASEIGLLGTAGLAVGAAIGGWKIGRAVSEFFDLDTAIGNATAKLLGWGDAVGEAAGAKADVLAKASKTVGYAITDLTVAMGINDAAAVTWRSNVDISTAAVKGWQAEITKVQTSGDLASLTADLASQNFTLKDLADRYHTSVEALQFFTRETKTAAEAERAASEITKTNNATKLRDLREEIDARREVGRVNAAVHLEMTKLDELYAVTATRRSGTISENEIAAINATFEVQRAALQKTGIYNAEVAAKFERDWQQALDGVGVDFEALGEYSTRNLQDIAVRAQATFEEATRGSSNTSREGIQHFRDLRDGAVNALHETAAEHAAMFAHMRDDVDRTSNEFTAWLLNAATDADRAALGFDNMGHAIDRVAEKTDKAAAAAKHLADVQKGLVTGIFDAAGNPVDTITGETRRAGPVTPVTVTEDNVANIRALIEKLDAQTVSFNDHFAFTGRTLEEFNVQSQAYADSQQRQLDALAQLEYLRRKLSEFGSGPQGTGGVMPWSGGMPGASPGTGNPSVPGAGVRLANRDIPEPGYPTASDGTHWWYTKEVPPSGMNRRDQYDSDAAWNEAHPSVGVMPRGGSAAAPITVTMNVSGLLLSNSPAGRAEFVDFAGPAIIEQLTNAGWRAPLGVRR